MEVHQDELAQEEKEGKAGWRKVTLAGHPRGVRHSPAARSFTNTDYTTVIPSTNMLLLHSGRSRVKGFFYFLVTGHLMSAVYGR